MTDDADDRYLGHMLRLADGRPDEAFVARTMRAVAAEERLLAARRATWRRLMIEAAAAAAVLAAFVLLGELAGPPEGSELSLVSPAAAAILTLAMWLATMSGEERTSV